MTAARSHRIVHIPRREWFTSAPYTEYFRAVDDSAGFYLYRWGDACVHFLAVTSLLEPEQVPRCCYRGDVRA